MSTCIFGGEYNTINGAVAGQTYAFTGSGGAGNYLTVRQGTPGGTVLAFGFSPISATPTVSGPIYLHVNTTAGCGTDGTCHTTTIQCTTCAGIANDVCTGALPIACGQTITGSTTGTGIDVVPTCGTTFGTSGGIWYTFLGDGQSTTLSMCGSAYDTKIGVFTGTCASLTCVTGNDDFCGLQSQVSLATLCGTTYYVLVTGFSTNTGAFTLVRTCTPADPCLSIGTLVCATPVTVTTCGAGAYNPVSANCGFGTPGQERIFSFTPTSTGIHTLVITAASGGFGDYFYKAASGGCNNSGWTCIGDASAPESNAFGPLTAGTTYYIMFDSEVIGTASQTFRVDCPAAVVPPPCPTTPSPINGASVCTGPVTLTWAASVGATSYDVYFGTTAVPPFVANVVTASYNAGTLAPGTYFWRIAPRNVAGPNTGCTTWSFTVLAQPVGALLSNPIVIGSLPYTQSNNNLATNCWGNDYVGANPQASPDVFYQFTSTACLNRVSISLCGSAFDTYLHLLNSAGTQIAFNDDNGPLCAGTASSIQMILLPGTYYIVVEGFSTNTGNYTLNVSATDGTPPTITCPASLTRNNDPGQCGAVVTYPLPTATDNCPSPTVTLLSGPASGSLFPVGVTTVVYRASDAANNSATCSFTVTVLDIEDATVVCPPNLTALTDPNQCTAAITLGGGLTVGDNCALASLTNDAPALFPVGTTIVIYTASDAAGNSSTCTQTVTVSDGQEPLVQCPPNITVQNDFGLCSAVVDFAATATDNCGVMTFSYSTDPLSDFSIGFTQVTATATDAQGFSTSCSFLVRVNPRLEACNGVDDNCDGEVDEFQSFAFNVKEIDPFGHAGDHYGYDVAVQGDYAIVGARFDDSHGVNSGAVYILWRNQDGDNAWGQVLKITPSDGAAGDQYGTSVAMHGDYAVVGAPMDDDQGQNAGSMYVLYRHQGGPNQWGQVAKLLATDGQDGDQLGISVGLDGNLAVAGANLEDQNGAEAGAAYVFRHNAAGPGSWSQVAKLLAADGGLNDNFGISVAMDGLWALVGADQNDETSMNTGAAYLFHRDQGGPGAWGQVKKLLPGGGGATDNFGHSVALDVPIAVVGAHLDDDHGTDAGQVYVFEQNAGGPNNWGETAHIFPADASQGDHFGFSVAVDSNFAVIGARQDGPVGPSSGSAYVFRRQSAAQWVLFQKLVDFQGKARDQFGYTVDIDNRTVIVGAWTDDNGTLLDQGSVTIFDAACGDDDGSNLREFKGEREAENVEAFDLRAYPSPFSDVLNVEVGLPAATDVHISVVNTLNQEVAVLHRGVWEGPTTLHWAAGAQPMGVYLVRVTADGKQMVRTVVLARP